MSSAKLLLESWQLATSPHSNNKTSIDLSNWSCVCPLLRTTKIGSTRNQARFRRGKSRSRLFRFPDTSSCHLHQFILICSVQTRKSALFISNSKKINENTNAREAKIKHVHKNTNRSASQAETSAGKRRATTTEKSFRRQLLKAFFIKNTIVTWIDTTS